MKNCLTNSRWPLFMLMAVSPTMAAAEEMSGKTLYAIHCAACHGKNLEGQPNWQTRNDDGTLPAPPHDETGHTWHHPEEMLFSYTKLGGKAVIGDDFKSGMPGFAGILNDEEIRSVLNYIESRWPKRIREVRAQRFSKE
jgi:mono/diheme cytochrome c family protein